MKKLSIILLIVLIVIPILNGFGQKVGLVLSGGGANGLAHIGVIQALEENNIPIDYITGTSSGAFVGAMYAAGYSVEEMKTFFLSEDFQNLVKGELKAEDRYYFKKNQPNAAMLRLKISKDFSLSNSLPTNIVSPSPVDFALMTLFSNASAASNYNFDSLLIPFRCVAADIDLKKEYVFSSGDLGTAIRASFTYPFYIKPIEVNDKLLFDGGLYNNFPHELMTNTFAPDFIIGVKVTSNDPPPKSDDLISQIKSMLTSQTDFDLKSAGLIIEPKTEHQTFDFKKLEAIIDSGYAYAIRSLPEIKKNISRRSSREQMAYDRKKFKTKMGEQLVSSIDVKNIDKGKSHFVKKIIWPKKGIKTIEEIKKGYYHAVADPRISTMFPSLEHNKMDNMYELNLNVTQEKPFVAEFGGVVSNRPISTAYVGVEYNFWEKTAWQLKGNTYFGRFYNSLHGALKGDISTRLPVTLKTSITLNSWNYFKSKSFFFDEDRPSYLIQNEAFADIGFCFPIGNKGKLSFQYSYAEMVDEYYQTQNFTSLDVPDRTTLRPNSASFTYKINTHNRIIYPNQGLLLKLMGRYSIGIEEITPGTTTTAPPSPVGVEHEWVDLQFTLDYYYLSRGKFRMGLYSDSYFSNLGLFSNYTASILKSPAFQPTPESKTLFLESFRAYQYSSIGHMFVYNMVRNIDLRVGGYLFVPYEKVVRDDKGMPTYETGINNVYSIANAMFVYNSPVGPVSFGMNYYYNVPEIAPENKTPLTFLFHFGYIIFNKKALY